MKGNKSSGLPSGHRYPLGAGRTHGKVSEFDPKTGRGYISFKRNNNKYKVAFDARDVSGYRREAIRVGLKVTFLTEQRETRSRAKDVIVTVPPPRSRRRLVRSNPHPDEVDEADAAARPVEVVNGGERVQTEDAAAQARRSFDMYVARALSWAVSSDCQRRLREAAMYCLKRCCRGQNRMLREKVAHLERRMYEGIEG